MQATAITAQWTKKPKKCNLGKPYCCPLKLLPNFKLFWWRLEPETAIILLFKAIVQLVKTQLLLHYFPISRSLCTVKSHTLVMVHFSWEGVSYILLQLHSNRWYLSRKEKISQSHFANLLYIYIDSFRWYSYIYFWQQYRIRHSRVTSTIMLLLQGTTACLYCASNISKKQLGKCYSLYVMISNELKIYAFLQLLKRHFWLPWLGF